MKHVLEHVGADFATFAAVMRKLYQVLTPDGLLEIHVPHLRHESFWSDPTHVRAFTPMTFQMMSKRQNEIWMEQGANYTMLAVIMGVEFKVEEIVQIYMPKWQAKVDAGEMAKAELRDKAERNWNVAKELQVRLRAVKDG